jgi:hypothetical protein
MRNHKKVRAGISDEETRIAMAISSQLCSSGRWYSLVRKELEMEIDAGLAGNMRFIWQWMPIGQSDIVIDLLVVCGMRLGD